MPPGKLLGRYEIRRLLGQGGMGCVYEAVHRDLKKRVAIKTLLPALASNADAKQRFLREGEAASRIRHPHVVDVTDVGAEGNVIYLVMEYLEGEDLARLIARQGYLSPTQTADIMLPVAAAIGGAHEQGVIHRDLKPENIFLARTGYGAVHPKVLDFGISKVLGDSRARALTGTSATMGTMNYLPPEQLRAAREADARSDQYGLGTILYECVTGQRAFDEESFYIVLKKIAEGEFVRPSVHRPDLPPRMEATIVRAMSLEPADRFESVKELGAALLEHASDASRMLWSPLFGTAPMLEQPRPGSGAIPSTSRTPSSPQGRIATMVAPETPAPVRKSPSSPPSSGPASGPIGGTMELPAPSRRAPSTTFRNATGERALPSTFGPRRSRAPMVVAGVALAAAIGVLIVLRGGGGGGNVRRDDVEQNTWDPNGTPTRSGMTAPERRAAPVEIERQQPPPPPPQVKGKTPAEASDEKAEQATEKGAAADVERPRRPAGKPARKPGKVKGGHGRHAPDGEGAPAAEPERAVPLPNQAPIIPL